MRKKTKKPDGDGVCRVTEVRATVRLLASIGGFESISVEYGETFTPFNPEDPEVERRLAKRMAWSGAFGLLKEHVADLDLPRHGKSPAGQLAISAQEEE